MNIVLLKKKPTKKTVNKQSQSFKRKRQKPKYWPQDFVNKSHSLADIIETKLSQWHDDEYDSGKDW